jgi:hypothetical protein
VGTEEQLVFVAGDGDEVTAEGFDGTVFRWSLGHLTEEEAVAAGLSLEVGVVADRPVERVGEVVG